MDKPSKLNERLTLFANLAVIAGIVLVAMELRQNTGAIESQTQDMLRESFAARADWLYAPLISPEHLRSVYSQVKAVDGLDGSVEALSERYELSVEDAVGWSFFLGRMWRGFEADFLYYGDSENLATTIRGLLSSPDQALYWQTTTDIRSPEFLAYVEGLRDGS